MDNLKLFFNGDELPITIVNGFTRGPMIGEYENKTIDISDMDGTEVISSRIKEGVIEVPFVIQGDLYTAHDEMMRILNVDGPKKLQFSDQMDRFYLAIPQGKPDAEELVQWFEKGSISFLVPSGVAYAEEETIVTNDREVVTETFVIDGVQGTGSIFVKDLPYKRNLLENTSDQWTNYEFSNWTMDGKNYALEELGLKVGDTVTYSIEVDNTASGNIDRVRAIFDFRDATETKYYAVGNEIEAGKSGFSVFQGTIKEGITHLGIRRIAKTSGSNKTKAKVRNHKLIKGTAAEMDTWCPATEDYGIVRGQPNLIDDTSNEWQKVTSNIVEKRVLISELGIKADESISLMSEFRNVNVTQFVHTHLYFTDINNQNIGEYGHGNEIYKGQTGTSIATAKVPEGAVYLTWRKARVQSFVTGDSFEYRCSKLIQGNPAAMDEWSPSQKDSGLTPHNPKLISETSNLFSSEKATLGYFQGWSYKSDLEANVNRACSVKIPVTAGKVYSVYSPVLTGKANFIVLACYDSQDNKTYMYRTDKWIVPDATHTSSASYRPIVVTIPSGTAYIRLAIDSNGGAMTRDKLVGYNLKLIEGDFTKNAGMVPFNADQYTALTDPLKYVRAETTQVGRGAELQFDFPVISELEKRHPYLFENTNSAEKTDKYLSILKSVKLVASSRGGGLNSTNTANSMRYYLLHLETIYANTWLLSTGAPDATQFQTKTVAFSGTFPKQIVDGGYRVYASSKKNNNPDIGAISDGITPAWVEVKDIKLEIEIELPRKNTITINNEGTHKTAPEFSFEFEEDNGYIGVVHQDGIIQYGSPSEVDGVTKQKSVVLLQDRFDNNKGWEINSSKAVTMLPMTANGTVKWDPIQSFVYPTDFGTGDGWHGVTLTQALSQEADNFTLESLSRIQDIWAEKAGRLEFTISAADGTPLFSMQFRDDSVSSSQNQFWAYVGNQEVDRDTSTWRWRWWLGSLTVRKAGNLWEWTIQNGQNKWTRQYLDGGYTVSNKKAARITIAFAAFGDKKPIAWEDVAKNKSGMGWSELRFVKDNVDYWVDLPNKMKAGDTVEIRNTEGKIYKYWQNQEPIQDMLDADIGNNYFLLPVGESEVQFHFSDYMSEPPLITAKYRKTYR
ncbi:distal tail protein Dit [Enterococcus sp. AZ072]|uniref:distal tail protein Dit n=1 Tax=unclassified Enterococcus TaxID=2608891 RepID=UPI003D2A7227